MKNELAQQIKDLEQEILALKTSTKFGAVAPASVKTFTNVANGYHTIIYEDGDTPIFSTISSRATTGSSLVLPSAPSGNTQLISVGAANADASTVTVSANRGIIRLD